MEKLNGTNRLNIAVKVETGDYKYVSRFFNAQLTARTVAREAVDKLTKHLPEQLEKANIKLQSYDGYLALLQASRKEIAAVPEAFGIDQATKDRALKDACWAVTCGADGSAAKLLAPRHSAGAP